MNCLLEFDRNFEAYTLIGTDEAGRGPGAGGVFAAAVCFKPEAYECRELKFLNDSKKLSEKKREFLYDIIKKNSLYSIKMVDIKEIERINILKASLLAMHLAVQEVVETLRPVSSCAPAERDCHALVSDSDCATTKHRSCVVDYVKHNLILIDGNKKIPNLSHAQSTIVKGDSKSAVIAAASILAKVERDRYMKKLHEKFPYYNWAKNKGYLTKEHIEAIKKHGPCEFHRPCFLKKILI